MNTIKVRPVLLPTKDKYSQLEIDDLSVGKLSYESKRYQCKNPMQFVLISLENNEIKVGDLFLVDDRDYVMNDPIYSIQKCKKIENEWIFGNDLDLGYNPDWSEKVIATQDQLSPELINQLIDEYNNGGMKDFEIEMEEDKSNLCDCYYTKYCKSTQLAPGVKCRDIKHYKPKLNNSFVCIVKKEPILYTEEEVKRLYDLSKTIIYTQASMINSYELKNLSLEIAEFENWFNQNKKK